jgi:hypothetical protein
MNSWELHIEDASYDELGWIARELVDGVCSQNLATMLSSVTTFLYLAIPRLQYLATSRLYGFVNPIGVRGEVGKAVQCNQRCRTPRCMDEETTGHSYDSAV